MRKDKEFTFDKLKQSKEITTEDCQNLFEYAKVLYELEKYPCKCTKKPYIYEFRGWKVPFQLEGNLGYRDLQSKYPCVSGTLGLTRLWNSQLKATWSNWTDNSASNQRHPQNSSCWKSNGYASSDFLVATLVCSVQLLCWKVKWPICCSACWQV
jgi:hypothetical protein